MPTDISSQQLRSKTSIQHLSKVIHNSAYNIIYPDHLYKITLPLTHRCFFHYLSLTGITPHLLPFTKEPHELRTLGTP